MKNRLVLSSAILLFLLLSFTSLSWAEVKFSAGGFGGINFPLVQEDSDIAGVAGFKARATVMPFLGLEPNFTYIRQGGITLDVSGTDMDREGGNIYAYGMDLVFGSLDKVEKFYWYFICGLYGNSLDRLGREDLNKFGFNLGVGLEILPEETFGIDFRTKVQIITIEGGSRKNIQLTGGVNYYFGGFGF
ncbi:MAG: hypothetical protein AMJ90_02835 [candidate division Zixibacteria bacterium SM23_73_2]|nr:MAG: hypothetical protein AMJ90_02835 [candidate division Zixibacteria bacterium SM23_73_2]